MRRLRADLEQVLPARSGAAVLGDARRPKQLYGRRRHLAALHGWIAELAAGRGRTAVVEGEPGIGKSALVLQASIEAQASGCQVYRATCDPLSRAFPMRPLLDAFRTGTPSGYTHLRINEMADLFSLPGNTVDLVSSTAERLLALVDDLCVVAPVLLVVDDLQYADPTTITVLQRLACAVRQLPLLLVLVGRPATGDEGLRSLLDVADSSDRIKLDPLADAEVAQLVAAEVGGIPGPGLLKMAAHAAGNPLHVTELVDVLRRRRTLTMAGDLVEAMESSVPTSLASAIADRLAVLSTPAHAALQFAAMLGASFQVSELATLVERHVVDLQPLLSEAVGAGVLLDDGTEMCFRHPLIRAAIYEGIPVVVRASWHRVAARALADARAAVDRVARQLLAALDINGEPQAEEWAVSWMAKSAHQLVGLAPRPAIRLLGWALTGATAGTAHYGPLTSQLADALYRAGQPDEAARIAEAGLEHVTQPEVLVHLHWTLGQYRAVNGRAEDSLVALGSALDAAGLGAVDRSRLLVLSARMHRSLGRLESANRVATEALELATGVGDRWAIAWALGVMTIVRGMLGEPEEALPLFDRTLAATNGEPTLGDLRLLMRINQAVALGDLDRYAQAISAAEQARRFADEAGNVVRLTQAQSVLGELLFDAGQWDEALAEIEVRPETFRDPTVECSDHGIAATIQLHRGDDTAADRYLAAAERYAARLGDRVVGSFVLAKSLRRERAGEPADALAMLRRGLADNVEEVGETAELLADVVRLAVVVGDGDAASAAVDRAEGLVRASRAPHRRAVVAHCRGLLRQDPVQLIEAADLYGTAGRPLPRAQALEAASVLLAVDGDNVGARSPFATACVLYADLGAKWDLTRMRAISRQHRIRHRFRAARRTPRQGWESLTPVEQRIVTQVARGMSNPRVAAYLHLSRWAVQVHLSRALAKLNLPSRADLIQETQRRRGVTAR
jgi:DNA-binding CsgD family transcriptional regulator